MVKLIVHPESWRTLFAFNVLLCRLISPLSLPSLILPFLSFSSACYPFSSSFSCFPSKWLRLILPFHFLTLVLVAVGGWNFDRSKTQNAWGNIFSKISCFLHKMWVTYKSQFKRVFFQKVKANTCSWWHSCVLYSGLWMSPPSSSHSRSPHPTPTPNDWCTKQWGLGANLLPLVVLLLSNWGVGAAGTGWESYWSVGSHIRLQAVRQSPFV